MKVEKVYRKVPEGEDPYLAAIDASLREAEEIERTQGPSTGLRAHMAGLAEAARQRREEYETAFARQWLGMDLARQGSKDKSMVVTGVSHADWTIEVTEAREIPPKPYASQMDFPPGFREFHGVGCPMALLRGSYVVPMTGLPNECSNPQEEWTDEHQSVQWAKTGKRPEGACELRSGPDIDRVRAGLLAAFEGQSCLGAFEDYVAWEKETCGGVGSGSPAAYANRVRAWLAYELAEEQEHQREQASATATDCPHERRSRVYRNMAGPDGSNAPSDLIIDECLDCHHQFMKSRLNEPDRPMHRAPKDGSQCYGAPWVRGSRSGIEIEECQACGFRPLALGPADFEKKGRSFDTIVADEEVPPGTQSGYDHLMRVREWAVKMGIMPPETPENPWAKAPLVETPTKSLTKEMLDAAYGVPHWMDEKANAPAPFVGSKFECMIRQESGREAVASRVRGCPRCRLRLFGTYCHSCGDRATSFEPRPGESGW